MIGTQSSERVRKVSQLILLAALVSDFGCKQGNTWQSGQSWAVTQRLAIMNTLFKKHPAKQWTHEGGEGGSVKRQIDYFLLEASKRWWATDAGTTDSIMLGSDHRGVQSSLKVRAGRKREKKKHDVIARAGVGWKLDDA